MGAVLLTALLAVAAFIVFSPKNGSSKYNASAPPGRPEKAEPTEVEAPVNFALPLYTKRAALVCPLSVAFDKREGYGLKGAVDAHLSIFGHEDAIEKSGCQEWHEGLSVLLTDEGQKQATEWESEKLCGMVSFADGFIFSCDLKNSIDATDEANKATVAPDTQPAGVTSVGPPHANAAALDITLDLNAIGNDQRPILNIKTNLPPKTILMASLANPMDLGGDGYFGQAKASVQANQVVQFGPFSKGGGRLSPGIYQVTASTVMAGLQPGEVQQFFGPHGERLTGPLVSTLPGTSERGVSQRFEFKINPDGSIGSLSPSSPPPIDPASSGPRQE